MGVHGDEEALKEVEFGMKILKFHKSSFERQIDEAVKIQYNRNHKILNSKSEFNRCKLPRLGLKWGGKEFNSEKEMDKEIDEMEKTLEEKIRQLRKRRSKERNR